MSSILHCQSMAEHQEQLKFVFSLYESPLGTIIITADDRAVLSISFADSQSVDPEILPGITEPIRAIKSELEKYFAGELRDFKTPYYFNGTPFQVRVWSALCSIPYAYTVSYREQAVLLQKPTGYRAVATANGANKLAIIIPCHRVINSNGALGGYRGGLARKRWLIDHEKRYSFS